MHFKLSTTAIVAAFATTAIGMIHGEIAEHGGKEYRFQQLAPGMFTGVPADEWDSLVHKPGHEEWNVEGVSVRSAELSLRDIELEARNLAETCQVITNCAKAVTNVAVASGYSGMMSAIDYAKNQAGTDILTFMERPFVYNFVTNVGTFTLVAFIGNRINDIFPPKAPPPYDGCSTSNDQTDSIRSAIAAAVSAVPDGSEFNLTVTGSAESWTLEIAVGAGTNKPEQTC